MLFTCLLLFVLCYCLQACLCVCVCVLFTCLLLFVLCYCLHPCLCVHCLLVCLFTAGNKSSPSRTSGGNISVGVAKAQAAPMKATVAASEMTRSGIPVPVHSRQPTSTKCKSFVHIICQNTHKIISFQPTFCGYMTLKPKSVFFANQDVSTLTVFLTQLTPLLVTLNFLLTLSPTHLKKLWTLSPPYFIYKLIKLTLSPLHFNPFPTAFSLPQSPPIARRMTSR